MLNMTSGYSQALAVYGFRLGPVEPRKIDRTREWLRTEIYHRASRNFRSRGSPLPKYNVVSWFNSTYIRISLDIRAWRCYISTVSVNCIKVIKLIICVIPRPRGALKNRHHCVEMSYGCHFERNLWKHYKYTVR